MTPVSLPTGKMMDVVRFNGFHKTNRALLRRLASDSRLSGSDYRIMLLALAMEREPGDEICLGRIVSSRMLGMLSRTFERSRKTLVAAGYLEVLGQGYRGAKILRIATPIDSTADMAAPGQITAGETTVGRYDGATADMQSGGAGVIHSIGNKETVQLPPPHVKKRHAAPSLRVTVSAAGFVIPAAMMASWTKAYPFLDIEQNIEAAYGRFLADGRKKSDLGRYLCNWLARSERWRREKADDEQPEYTEEQLRRQEELGATLMAEGKRRRELGIPDWEECPA